MSLLFVYVSKSSQEAFREEIDLSSMVVPPTPMIALYEPLCESESYSNGFTITVPVLNVESCLALSIKGRGMSLSTTNPSNSYDVV